MHCRLLACFACVLALVSDALAESDLKEIFKHAASELAWRKGTTIQPNFLAAGFCFSREDQTSNAVSCIDEPPCKLILQIGSPLDTCNALFMTVFTFPHTHTGSHRSQSNYASRNTLLIGNVSFLLRPSLAFCPNVITQVIGLQESPWCCATHIGS